MSDLDQLLASQAAAPSTRGNPQDALETILAAQAAAPQATSQPVAVQAGQAVNSIPRQIGLTARYGLEGLANVAQIGTEPLRYLTDRLTGQTGKTVPLGVLASQLADKIGLPSPQGANERVIGDASRLVAGAAGLGGVARVASSAVSDAVPAVTSRLGQFAADFSNAARTIPGALAQNMPQQLSSAAGAGLLGGSAREAGAGPLGQAGASLVGGVAGGLVPGAIDSTVGAVRNLVSRPAPQALDAQIRLVLNRSGVDLDALPQAAQNSLRNDLRQALNTGQELDAAAVRRLADFRAVGATPTRGAVTLDPVQITREQNLSKVGANSADGVLQGLPRIQNQNNSTLIRSLNAVGGASETDPLTAGRVVAGSVLGQQADLRSAETAAWNAARNSPGYTQPIEAHVVSQINQALGEQGMMPFLNPTISRYMEAFQTGQQPFTPQAYRNLQSMLSNELSRGGNEAAAARLARNVLEGAELRPITNPRGIDFGNALVTQNTANAMRAADAAPGQAIEAVNRARAATRAAYAFEDSNPLVRSVLSDGRSGDPTRIAQQFVIGGTPDEAATVAQQVGPQGRAVIRDALATYIKKQALSGATDEVGKVSQSALNSVLRKIGDEKLRLFFSPEEVAQLHSTGRVASYLQVQPVGSAVNNSNSGAMLIGKGYDALRGIAGKIPGGQSLILNPLNNIEIGIRNRQAQNVIPGLLVPEARPPMGQSLLLPGMAVGGLLAAPASP